MKPHLPYDQQLARMSGRGLGYDDRSVAVPALKRIGYYPLSAYTYPFRQQSSATDPETGRQRAEAFRPGSKLEDALWLYDFDAKLRIVLLQALHEIEVGLAVKIGYTLGKRAPDGHLRVDCLDRAACEKTNFEGRATHDVWLDRYGKLRSGAREEEYVKHHILHYAGEIPIWVATGFMDLGCLVRLYSLMRKDDRKRIAADFGLAGNGSEQLFRWLKALNILRNHCAHNGRIWNRSTVEVPPKIPAGIVPGQLRHLNDLGEDERLKLYLLIALAGFLVEAVTPDTNWAKGTLPSLIKKFDSVAGMTPKNTMGFPHGWLELPLWKRQ